MNDEIRNFKIDRIYASVGWFGGGEVFYLCVRRTEDTVTMRTDSDVKPEIVYPIERFDGEERVLLKEYAGEKGFLHASDADMDAYGNKLPDSFIKELKKARHQLNSF